MEGKKSERGHKVEGELAEAQVLLRLLQQGFSASWAVGDSARWDLVSDWHGHVNRLQVKATRKVQEDRGTWRILMCHGSKIKEVYTEEDCDYIVAVLPWGMYVIPIAAVVKAYAAFWQPGEHPRCCTQKYNTCKYEEFREAWHLLKS